MGLDMYALKTKVSLVSDVDFDIADDAVELIHRWRKHPNLHGWMEKLYRQKSGANEDFNCVNVALTSEDLDSLEKDIHNGALPTTFGFFFGESDGTETEDDLLFISKARKAIQDGNRVFYSSWW